MVKKTLTCSRAGHIQDNTALDPARTQDRVHPESIHSIFTDLEMH